MIQRTVTSPVYTHSIRDQYPSKVKPTYQSDHGPEKRRIYTGSKTITSQDHKKSFCLDRIKKGKDLKITFVYFSYEIKNTKDYHNTYK